MFIEGKACWLSHLIAALERYYKRVGGTTRLTPFEISTNNKPIDHPNSTNKPKQPKY